MTAKAATSSRHAGRDDHGHDVDEPPAAPAAPTVVSGIRTTPGQESTTSLKVVWHAPDNTGDDITDYDVEYKKTTGLSFTERIRVTRLHRHDHRTGCRHFLPGAGTGNR